MRKYLVPCMLCAASYYIFALVGLSVAIPPGRASLVWPAAGVALGAVYVYGPRMLFGVWFGSFLANLWVAPHFTDAIIPAVGAAIQAAVGAWVMHRLLCAPWIWTPAQVLIFFSVASVTAGINGFWGPAMLELEPFWLQVRTWWTGDAVGACLMTPVVVFLASEAAEQERLTLTMDELLDLRKESRK